MELKLVRCGSENFVPRVRTVAEVLHLAPLSPHSRNRARYDKELQRQGSGDLHSELLARMHTISKIAEDRLCKSHPVILALNEVSKMTFAASLLNFTKMCISAAECRTIHQMLRLRIFFRNGRHCLVGLFHRNEVRSVELG